MAFYETVSLRLQTLELMLDTSLMRTLLVYAESTAADVSNLVSALSEALGPETDAELPKAPWFDAAHFPQAGFQTTAIKALGDGRFEMAGKLTLKGIARPLTVPVTIAPAANGQSVASGSFVLQRIDYKVGDGEWTDTSVIANEVQVRFKLVVDGLGAP